MSAMVSQCAGTEPPQCCQPAPVPAERLERLAAEIAARAPGCCPHCGARKPAPAFVKGADVWICADWRCGRWFVAVD